MKYDVMKKKLLMVVDSYFAPDFIKYAFAYLLNLLNMHPFQTQNLWEESIQMNHTTQFTNVCTRHISLVILEKCLINALHCN